MDASTINKLDLLFVVDNSNSMADEQARLAQQFPRLINTLTTGRRSDNDPHPFPPVEDLHLGVVTTDLGLPGVQQFPGCAPDGGDDARLQSKTRDPSCPGPFPSFLAYSSAVGTDPMALARDFACIAQVGTQGCGIEQPLEAGLKALWPMVYVDGEGNVVTPNPITFLATTPQGTFGRGDLPVAQGGNMGLLRNDANTGLSLLGVIVVTDEDDCSMRSTDAFFPSSQLPQDSPYSHQDINLRCHYNQELLYNVDQRYRRALQLLRSNRADLVVFGAIVGVPVDTVDSLALAGFDYSDAMARSRFYDALLNDPRMREEIDPATNPGQGTGNVKPSCARIDRTDKVSLAYPPRRIVELAKSFGENGIVQSICQDDFGPALGPIVDRLSEHLGQDCLNASLKREVSGKVSCDVIWELPRSGTAPMTTPTECAQTSFLKPISGRRGVNDRNGKNCLVTQLAVTDNIAEDGEGWYYDDFSESPVRGCRAQDARRVAFSPAAKPPSGVRVVLDCKSAALDVAH